MIPFAFVVAADRDIRIPASGSGSASQRMSHCVRDAKQDRLPRVPAEQAVDDLTASPDDLARHADERVDETLGVHPHDVVPLGLVAMPPPTGDRRQQTEPHFQIPSQPGHQHIRPVAIERIERRPQCVDSVLELIDQVLLITSLVRTEHDLVSCRLPVIRDIEEVPDLIPQLMLPFAPYQVLFQRNDPVRLAALDRCVLKLCDFLVVEVDGIEFTANNHLLFHIRRAFTSLGLDFVLRIRGEQRYIYREGQGAGNLHYRNR